MLKHLLLLPLSLLLAACSLTQYNVSESEINQYLKERVAFEKQLGIPGIMSSKVRLDEMQSRIGRSSADRIELDAAGDLQVSSPLGSQQMKIRFSLSARPDYVAEQGAIYLRDLELVSCAIWSSSRSRRSQPTWAPPSLPCSPPSTSPSPCSSPRPPSTVWMAVAKTKPGSKTR
ncbi:hypothetical protein LMCDFJHI_00242 [Aeromonas salmonicida]